MRKFRAYDDNHAYTIRVQGHTAWMTGAFSHNVIIDDDEDNRRIVDTYVFCCEDAEEAALHVCGELGLTLA